MKPTKELPVGYRLIKSIDLSKQVGLLVILNLVGLGLFVLFGFLFYAWAMIFHASAGWDLAISEGVRPLLFTLLLLGLVYVAVLALHEIVHGIVFWLVTHERPRFGLRSMYAYAAAPDWYIPKPLYLRVGLAPLVAISLGGLLVVPFLPTSALPFWWFFLTANASGAVGDIYVVGWLALRIKEALINDHGDRMLVYTPASVETTS